MKLLCVAGAEAWERQIAALKAERDELRQRPLYTHGYEDGKSSRQGEVDALQKDLDRLRKGFRESDDLLLDCGKKCDALRDENAKLREGLYRYSVHEYKCPGENDCHCGLSALLKEE